MALSLILSEAKLTAELMETSAKVTLEQVEGGYAITAVHLTLKAKIPGADQATFEKLSSVAKVGCPVSKLLILLKNSENWRCQFATVLVRRKVSLSAEPLALSS